MKIKSSLVYKELQHLNLLLQLKLGNRVFQLLRVLRIFVDKYESLLMVFILPFSFRNSATFDSAKSSSKNFLQPNFLILDLQAAY